MPVIKLHLEDEEYSPVRRVAERLGLKPEDIAYAALDRLMLSRADPQACKDITDGHVGRRENLPTWADSARSVHAYEGKHDDYEVQTD